MLALVIFWEECAKEYLNSMAVYWVIRSGGSTTLCAATETDRSPGA